MALNDALNKSTLTLHSSKKIGRLLMPTENGPTGSTTTATAPNVVQQWKKKHFKSLSISFSSHSMPFVFV
jgi:hypothetical protein